MAKRKNRLRDREIPSDKAGPLPRMVIQRGDDGEAHCHHHPFEDTLWLPVSRDGHMRPDDAVLGFLVEGTAYALPWWIMKNHHVANLLLHGQCIMVVLCEACAGASAFNAMVAGTRYRFQVEGKYNGTHILKDLETGSLWTPFDGKAVHGPLEGTELQQMPLHQCTWAEWKDLNPGTLVPDGEGESREGHGACFPNPSTIGPMPFAVVTSLHLDYRLAHQSLVLGVQVDGIAWAYPLGRLRKRGPVVNHRIGKRPVVVFSTPASWLAVAYDRAIDGRALTFEVLSQPDTDRGHARDAETGSIWSYYGKAIAGPLKGRSLTWLPCNIEKWVGWATAHPDTGIFRPRTGPARGVATTRTLAPGIT